MDNYLRNHLTYYLKHHVQILENYEKQQKDIKIYLDVNIFLLTGIKDLDDIILDYKKDLDNYEKERKIDCLRDKMFVVEEIKYLKKEFENRPIRYRIFEKNGYPFFRWALWKVE